MTLMLWDLSNKDAFQSELRSWMEHPCLWPYSPPFLQFKAPASVTSEWSMCPTGLPDNSQNTFARQEWSKAQKTIKPVSWVSIGWDVNYLGVHQVFGRQMGKFCVYTPQGIFSWDDYLMYITFLILPITENICYPSHHTNSLRDADRYTNNTVYTASWQ